MSTKTIVIGLCLVVLLAGCAGESSNGLSVEETAPRSETVIESETVVYPPITGTPGTVEVRGGDEGALRELLGRVLTFGGPEAGSVLVLVGESPGSLPFSLPLPDNADILGSVLREERAFYGTEMYLHVELTPEQTMDFYRQNLDGDDWRLPEEPGSSSGFISEPYPSGTFCHIPTGASVWINAFRLDEGTTDLRLSIQTANEYSICEQDYGSGYEDKVQRILPLLAAPPGAMVKSGGMSSGGNEGDMSAIVQTELSAEELATYYGNQLLDVGWTGAGSGSSEVASWSFWKLVTDEDETWIGTFLVFESTVKAEEFFAWFRIELEVDGT